MKIIISESQKKKISVIRRFNSDFDAIWDIVDEGIDMYLCRFDDFDSYYEYVCENSAMTYLFHYFDSVEEEGYLELEKYITKFIKKEFSNRIREIWVDNRDNCI
jgi:RNAse (barnase) inhibitor barstar